jgi:lipoprotein-releasing system ATP-binding protein
MPETEPLLQLEAVTKRYDSPGGGKPTEVLKGINLRAAAGESLAVVGPSGSGKSTLLNIIGTLDRPTTGRVVLGRQELSAMPAKALAAIRNRQIGFVFQLHHLLPQCTVLENVLIPTLVGDGEPVRAAAERARRLLERVGLGERVNYRPGQISGGERQRVAVVRALINQPRLLLADEPTGSLDRAGAEDLASLLVELNRQEGMTLIAVTHSMPIAARMGKVLELRDGKLLEGAEAR